MLVAFGAAGIFGCGRSLRLRQAAPARVRENRPLPPHIEWLWKAVPPSIAVALLVGVGAPQLVTGGAFNQLRHSSPVLAAGGAVLFVSAAVLLWTSARHLGRQLTVEIEVREGDALVASGPYARTRHPIYTAMILMCIGLAIAFASPALAVLAGAAAACANSRAQVEEDLLGSDAAHGAVYKAYLARTGRFLPRFRAAVVSPDTISAP